MPESPKLPSKFIVPRSGYTLHNALKWRTFFDAAIETKQNIFIETKPKNAAGYIEVSTMKNRITDGLKWLAEHNIDDFLENSSFKQEDYKDLKDNVNILHQQNGVLIRYKFRKESRSSSNFNHSVINNAAQQDWQEELIKFLQNEHDTGPFHRNGLSLTDDQQNVVRKLAAGMEYEVTGTKITVVK